mgnify:CR=1 FL=1
MKKIKIICFLIFFASFIYSCTTMNKGFESQRKKSTDEFLVEKKQPLVMPPDFEKLPIPEENQTNSKQEKINQIEELIVTDNSTNTNTKKSSTSSQKTENFILDKIKN